MEPWAWAIAVTIALSLIGAIWLLFRSKVERTESRLDDHVKEDVAAHERLKAVETEVANLKLEVTTLRERWHDMRGDVTTALASWYSKVVEMIERRK